MPLPRWRKEKKMVFQTSPEIGGMGHSIKRKEDQRFLQGKGNYVDDVVLPDMVYGQVPVSRASIKKRPCSCRAF
jgi:aerobic carbon-monoxide dehydrogenase large subunit